jgi:hypothetical protein
MVDILTSRVSPVSIVRLGNVVVTGIPRITPLPCAQIRRLDSPEAQADPLTSSLSTSP